MSPLAIVEIDGVRQYQYVDSYEIQDKQLDPVVANYNPLGATDTQGCANCQWFLAPGRCVVVSGEISPTGLSDLWMAKTAYAQTPLLVQIVTPDTKDVPAVIDHPRTMPDYDPKDPKANKRKKPHAGLGEPTKADQFAGAVKSADSGPSAHLGLVQGLRELVARFAGSAPSPAVQGDSPNPFTLYRTKDDRVRFLTAWSNNFTDREGEIFPESAHKEYIEWADRNQQYPELWLWHTKGTKYGQVDWLDYTDGFVYASGLIDAGREDLAEALSKEDCGVSHGFHGLQRGKEIILYRPFEISTLPRTNAAVWTTSFEIIGEGAKEMAFTQQKKTWLKEHGLDDAAITAAETQATALSKSLRDLGIAYKDTDLVEEPVVDAAKAAKTSAAEKADEEEDAADAKKKKGNPFAKEVSDFQAEMLVQATKQTEILAAVAAGMAGLDARVKAVEATDDQKIAATIAARATGASTGVSASKDTQNVVEQAQATADQEWFGKVFVGPLSTGAQ